MITASAPVERQAGKSGVWLGSPTWAGYPAGSTSRNRPELVKLLRTTCATSAPKAASAEAKLGMAMGMGVKLPPVTVICNCASTGLAAIIAAPESPSLSAVLRVIEMFSTSVSMFDGLCRRLDPKGQSERPN